MNTKWPENMRIKRKRTNKLSITSRRRHGILVILDLHNNYIPKMKIIIIIARIMMTLSDKAL